MIRIKALHNPKEFLDVELRNHSRTIASADIQANLTQVLRLAPDTVLLLQDAVQDKATVNKIKVRFLDESGAFDQKLPTLEHIKIEAIQAAVNEINKQQSMTQLTPSVRGQKTNLDDVVAHLSKLKSTHSALGLEFDKASESTVLSDEWLTQLSKLQQETAITVDDLQTSITAAFEDNCHKAAHFLSDFYRLKELQDHNKKKGEAVTQKLKKLEKRNEDIRNLGRERLDSLVKELNDPRLLEKIAKHNSEIEQYLSIYYNEAYRVDYSDPDHLKY